MAGDKSIWKAITGASFLVMLIIVLVFLYAQSFTPSSIFPQETEAWNKILTGYLVIFSLMLIVAGIVERELVLQLAKANYWRSFFLKFIPSAVVVSIILIVLKGILKGTDSINLFNAISYMPVSVVLVMLFVVSNIEEIMNGVIFRIVDKRSGKFSANIVTMFLFAIWHFAKTGGNWIIMLTYVPLRYWWNYVMINGTPFLNNISPQFFGATPYTQQANAGSHFAWNMFIIGFIKPFQI